MAKAKPVVGGGMQVSASRAEQRPSRKHVTRLEIAKAANGGMTVRHHYASGAGLPYEAPTEHAFGKGQGAAALEHVRKHLRLPTAGGDSDGDAPS